MIFCSECGTKNYDTAKFCRKCGASMIFTEDETKDEKQKEIIETPTPTVNRTEPTSPVIPKEEQKKAELPITPVNNTVEPKEPEEEYEEEDDEEYEEEEDDEYTVEEESEDNEEEDDYEEENENSSSDDNITTPVSASVNPANNSYWDDVVPEIEEEIYRIPKDIILKFVFGCVAIIILIIILIYCVNSI